MGKVLHLIGNFREDSGGAQRVILDIVNNCDHSDLQMGVCSLFGEATLAKRLPPNTFDANFNYSLKHNPNIFWDLYRLISDWKPDILHVHSPVVGIFGRPVAKMCGIKLLSTVHTDVRKTLLRNKILDKLTIHLSDSLVCVSDLAKETVLEEYGNIRSDIHTIMNCLDVDEFEKGINKKTGEKRKELNLENKSFIVGTVGRLHRQKGQKYLVKAWQRVIKRYPDSALLLIGGGEKEAELKRLSKDLNVAESIYFLGYRNDVPELLNMMDIFVFPSLWEGLGIAALEAMSLGKIVIASDIKPLNNVIGNSGVLVPPANDELLGKSIINTLNNFEEKKQLGHAARERVLTQFSPKKFGQKYSSVYRELL